MIAPRDRACVDRWGEVERGGVSFCVLVCRRLRGYYLYRAVLNVLSFDVFQLCFVSSAFLLCSSVGEKIYTSKCYCFVVLMAPKKVLYPVRVA